MRSLWDHLARVAIILITLNSGAVGSEAQSTPQNEWTWEGGNSTVALGTGDGRSGTYGTQGIPSSQNQPGARRNSSMWRDKQGNLWLFGGVGVDSSGKGGYLNDLWKFTTSSHEWAWMSGSDVISLNCGVPVSTLCAPAAYGTQGLSSADNHPGSRQGAAAWTDQDGNFWLMGGYGVASNDWGNLNDLWKFNPSSNQWTWIGGSSTVSPGKPSGVYGALGIPASSNVPGGRWQATTWQDASGHLWLFGGNGYDSAQKHGYLNDLWEFNPSTLQWTWQGGSNVLSLTSVDTFQMDVSGAAAVYGTLGTPSPQNIPGGRYGASGQFDNAGHVWIYGGAAFDSNGHVGVMNDLWEFTPSTHEWTWMGGAKALNCVTYIQMHVQKTDCSAPSPVFGDLGTPSETNNPGGLFGAANWTDAEGNLWFFGQDTILTNGTAYLWGFNTTAAQWTWMGGGSLPGIYGTVGVPSQSNVPGTRSNAAYWTDSNGNFWLFGGFGFDSTTFSANLNDLWRYVPSSNPTFAATETPSFSPTPGSYQSVITVTISAPTPYAAIYYTTDGFTTPTTGSTRYVQPIAVSADQTIQAIAVSPNHLPSDVKSATYHITIPVPDFSVALTPSSLSIQSGQSATTSFTVTPTNGFNATVNFSCSGLPAGVACNFSPSTVTPSGSPVSTTLTLQAATTSAGNWASNRSSIPLFPTAVLAASLLCLGFRRVRYTTGLLLLALCVTGTVLLTACSSSDHHVSPPKQPVTATVTLTATSATIQHSANLSLTVN